MLSNSFLDTKGCNQQSWTGSPSLFLDTKGCTQQSPTKPPKNFSITDVPEENFSDRLNSYFRT